MRLPEVTPPSIRTTVASAPPSRVPASTGSTPPSEAAASSNAASGGGIRLPEVTPPSIEGTGEVLLGTGVLGRTLEGGGIKLPEVTNELEGATVALGVTVVAVMNVLGGGIRLPDVMLLPDTVGAAEAVARGGAIRLPLVAS
jgi:hypothetical protein